MADRPALSPPLIEDYAAFPAFRADAARWLPMARDIASSHSVVWSDPVVFATDTNLVVGLGRRLILKNKPPLHHNQNNTKQNTMRILAGQLHIEVPEIIAEG